MLIFKFVFFLYQILISLSLELPKNVTKIAFGSCYGIFGKKSPIFETVI
jgi:hypothetical protein